MTTTPSTLDTWRGVRIASLMFFEDCSTLYRHQQCTGVRKLRQLFSDVLKITNDIKHQGWSAVVQDCFSTICMHFIKIIIVSTRRKKMIKETEETIGDNLRLVYEVLGCKGDAVVYAALTAAAVTTDSSGLSYVSQAHAFGALVKEVLRSYLDVTNPVLIMWCVMLGKLWLNITKPEFVPDVKETVLQLLPSTVVYQSYEDANRSFVKSTKKLLQKSVHSLAKMVPAVREDLVVDKNALLVEHEEEEEIIQHFTALHQVLLPCARVLKRILVQAPGAQGSEWAEKRANVKQLPRNEQSGNKKVAESKTNTRKRSGVNKKEEKSESKTAAEQQCKKIPNKKQLSKNKSGDSEMVAEEHSKKKKKKKNKLGGKKMIEKMKKATEEGYTNRDDDGESKMSESNPQHDIHINPEHLDIHQQCTVSPQELSSATSVDKINNRAVINGVDTSKNFLNVNEDSLLRNIVDLSEDKNKILENGVGISKVVDDSKFDPFHQCASSRGVLPDVTGVCDDTCSHSDDKVHDGQSTNNGDEEKKEQSQTCSQMNDKSSGSNIMRGEALTFEIQSSLVGNSSDLYIPNLLKSDPHLPPSVSTDEEEYPQVSPALKSDGITNLTLTMDSPDRVSKPIFTSTFYGLKEQKTQYFQPCGTPKTMLKDRYPGNGSVILTPPNPTTTKSPMLPSPKRGIQDKNENSCNDILIVHNPEKVKLASNMEYELELCSVLLEEDSVNKMERSTRKCYDTTTNSDEKKKKESKADNVSQKKNIRYQIQTRATSKNVYEENAIKETILTSACSKSSECNMDSDVCGSAKVKKASNKCNKKSSAVQPSNKNSSSDVRRESSRVNDFLVADKGTRNTDSDDYGVVSYLVNELTMTEEHNNSDGPDLAYGIVNKEGLDADRDTEQILKLKAQNVTLRKKKNKPEQKKCKRGREELYSMSTNSRKVKRSEDMKRETGKLKKRSKRIKRTRRCLNSTNGSNGASEWEVSDNTSIDSNIRTPKSYFPALNMDENGNSYIITTEIVSNGWNSHVLCKDLDIPFMESEVPIACNLGIDETNGSQDILDASVKTSHGNEDQPEVLLPNQMTNKQAVDVDGNEVLMKNLNSSTDSIDCHNKSNNILVHQLSIYECNNHKANESTLGGKNDSGKDHYSNIGTTNMSKENMNPESKITSPVRTRNILKASIFTPETTTIRTVNISEVNLKDSENNATTAVEAMNVSDLSKQNDVSNPSTKDNQHKYTPAEKAHQRNTTLSQDECYLLELYRTRPSETKNESKEEGNGEDMDVSVDEDSQQSTLLTAGALALLEKQELINKTKLDGGQGAGSKFNHEQLNGNPPRTRKSTEKKKLQQKKVRIIRRTVREPPRPSVSRTYNPLTFTRKELDPRCNATHHGCPGMAKEEEPLIKYGRKKKKVNKAKEMVPVLSKKKIENLVQKLLKTDGTLEKNKVQSDNKRANYSANKKVFGTNKNRKERKRLMVNLQKQVTSINKERSDVCEQTEFPITTGKIADLSETNFIISQGITTTHTTSREGKCLEERDQEKQNTNNAGTSKTNKTIDNKVEGLNNCNEIAAVNHNSVVSLSHNGKMNDVSHQNRVGYISPGPSHYGNLTKEKGLSFAKLDPNNTDSPTSYPFTINQHLPLRDEENGPSCATMGGKALDVSSRSLGLSTKLSGPRPFFTASTPKISRWPGFGNDAKSSYSTKFQKSQIEENNFSDIIFKEENLRLLPEADYVTLEKSITPSSLQWLKEECPDCEKNSGESGSSKIFFSALEEFDDVSSHVLHTETIENWKLNTERIDVSKEEEEHCPNTLKDMRDYYTPPCQTPDNIAMLPLTKTCNKKTEEEMTPNYDHSLVEAVSNPWEEKPISQNLFPDLPGDLHGPLGLDKSSLCAPSHSHSTAKTNRNIQESPMQAQVLSVQMDRENNELFARLPILHVPHTVCKEMEMDVHFYRTSPNHSDTALLFDNHTYRLSVPKQQSHNGSLTVSSVNDFTGRTKHSTCRRKLLDSFVHGKQEGKSKPKSMERHLSPKIITNSTSLQEGRLLTSELTSSPPIHVCKCGFVHSCRGEQQRGIVNNNIKSSSTRKRNNSAEGVKDKNFSNYKNKYLPQIMNPWSPCLGTHICNLQTAQFQQATRPTAGIPEATADLCPHHRKHRGRPKHLMNPKLMLVSCQMCRLSLLERRQCTFHQEPCHLVQCSVEGEVVHGYTQQIDLLGYREYVRVISEAFPKYKDIILPEPSKMAPLCSFHMVSEVSDAEAFCLVVPTPPNSSGTVGTAENLNTSLDSLFALLGPEELSCIDSPTGKHAHRPSTKKY
ncbi:hypothetical protein Pmani_017875 [Petrolisthes manimaculis]|uniref:Uncharacterized protein n=1 Tax=Petrolisthes manimaculis TaxID=1843537 RepID=A0AAE1PLI9_9EUCA|nr:hypothetical protein Pmani_017875 [Petrolisthes manimaculis]